MLIFLSPAQRGALLEAILRRSSRRGVAWRYAPVNPRAGIDRETGSVVRRPRAWFASHAPGRSRDPARAALRPLREELRWTGRPNDHAVRTKARQGDELNWRCGPENGSGRAPGNAAPGTEIAVGGAPRGARALSLRAARYDGCAFRRSAPLAAFLWGSTPPRALARGPTENTAYSAPQRIGVIAHVRCLKFKSPRQPRPQRRRSRTTCRQSPRQRPQVICVKRPLK
jgi:hypothetical protein